MAAMAVEDANELGNSICHFRMTTLHFAATVLVAPQACDKDRSNLGTLRSALHLQVTCSTQKGKNRKHFLRSVVLN